MFVRIKRRPLIGVDNGVTESGVTRLRPDIPIHQYPISLYLSVPTASDIDLNPSRSMRRIRPWLMRFTAAGPS